jgi:hypothetical protein
VTRRVLHALRRPGKEALKVITVALPIRELPVPVLLARNDERVELQEQVQAKRAVCLAGHKFEEHAQVVAVCDDVDVVELVVRIHDAHGLEHGVVGRIGLACVVVVRVGEAAIGIEGVGDGLGLPFWGRAGDWGMSVVGSLWFFSVCRLYDLMRG